MALSRVVDKDRGELRIHENLEELSTDLADYIAEISETSVKERGVFSVALSGGSLIHLMRKLCDAPYNRTVDWAKWHVFWADERVVAKNHSDSNFKLAKDGLLSKVPVLPSHLHSINDAASAEEAANGHIAFLFPNHPVLDTTDEWVTFIADSPMPPPERITFTLPVINSASNVAVVVTGESKAGPLHSVIEGSGGPSSCLLTARMVQPVTGKLVWFLDKEAASELNSVNPS
ncbi:hypothetical protein MLD38_017447 [Melastoma candidum]|uniref:Uncharacterized protein n=1 Tax=Melastoma candidum TaxID=119954 RepID=A0ACB9QRS9_9MYRT|nr:hypothetical protein MLD38_017447 [Melastoma candidum]